MPIKNQNAIIALVIGVFSICFISFISYELYFNPNIIYLSQTDEAEWIKVDRPFKLKAENYQQTIVQFRKIFEVDQPINIATLVLRSLRFSRVFLDNQLVFESSTKPDQWKKADTITISDLTPGSHTLLILVMNYDGPPALNVTSKALNIGTDLSWESSVEENTWKQVALASKPSVLEMTTSYTPTYKSFYQTLPAAIVIILICVGTYFYVQKPQAQKFLAENPAKLVSYSHYIVLILWTVLTIYSLINNPVRGGDYPAHLQYIFYIATKSRLPLASDGWQMFQAPLYYVVSAIIFKFFYLFLDAQSSFQMLKIVPLISGIVIAEASHRTVKLAFPNQYLLQIVGTFVGGFMPMTMYMSQYIGNEIVAGAFTSLLILIAVYLIRNPEQSLKTRPQLLLGATLGFGLLAKVSVGLLLVPCFVAFSWVAYNESKKITSVIIGIARLSAIVLLIAGWYYIRNWIYLGSDVVVGKSNNIPWWQDPGFRMADNYLRFGLSLIYPINSCTVSFWDALYSSFWLDSGLGGNINPKSNPPWNYSYLLSLPLLSIAPTVLMIVGIYPKSNSFGKNDNSLYWFCIAAMGIYFTAILFYYTKIPIYSAGKSTYALGLIPCFTIMFVRGFSALNRGKKSLTALLMITAFLCIYSYYAFLPIHP